MSMGTRERGRQEALWVEAGALPVSPGHPFYERVNRLLSKHGFDAMVEEACGRFYAEVLGRPSIPPGVYFRMLFIGYFEGIDSERGIAWRTADSMALRSFLGCGLTEGTPDHSSLSRMRHRIDLETHQGVFDWMLCVLAKEGVLQGKTLGVDATTLEANAALRSIVRRDTGESYEQFLTRLAQASGIETPTREDLARIDRNRPGKGSNRDWQHPHDPDARITKMKDGCTHLAHKAEHAVDMDSGAVVAVTVQGADQGDTKTLAQTVEQARASLSHAAQDPQARKQMEPVRALVADKGYHSNDCVREVQETYHLTSYISEPNRGRRNWEDNAEAQQAVYANRRRIRGDRGKRLLRLRGERVERSFAHLYETGGMRRTHLRGHPNILKRLLIHAAGFNLSLILRRVLGVGTPRRLQDFPKVLLGVIFVCWRAWKRLLNPTPVMTDNMPTYHSAESLPIPLLEKRAFATGC
jgi:transposase